MEKVPLWGYIYKTPLKLFKFLMVRQAKCWGVEREANLPPEFIITEHAYQRIQERFNCAKEKIEKVVVKAWFSRDVVPKEFIILKEQAGYTTAGYNSSKYRLFQGHIFVFLVHPDKYNRYSIKRLITVYHKPNNKRIKSLPQFSSYRPKKRTVYINKNKGS